MKTSLHGQILSHRFCGNWKVSSDNLWNVELLDFIKVSQKKYHHVNAALDTDVLFILFIGLYISSFYNKLAGFEH